MVQEQKLKEKNFDLLSFIGGWYIPTDLCDELIDYFNYNKKYSVDGTVAVDKKGLLVNKEVKDSIDLHIGPKNLDFVVGEYRKYLHEVLLNYLNKFEAANNVASFNVLQKINIQKYPKGGGYKEWHAENYGDDYSITRHLVFMTYLNDVKDGGTEFMYQNIKTQAEKGLTLIWPAQWTHTHRGIVSKNKEKYIITGWYNFELGEKND